MDPNQLLSDDSTPNPELLYMHIHCGKCGTFLYSMPEPPPLSTGIGFGVEYCPRCRRPEYCFD